MTPLVVLPHRQGLCLCPLHVKGYAACAVAPVRRNRDGCECADASGTCAPLLRTWLLSRMSVPTPGGPPYALLRVPPVGESWRTRAGVCRLSLYPQDDPYP